MASQTFKVKPSRFYCCFLGITLLASVIIVTALPLNFWLKILLLCVLPVYGVMIFRRYALLLSSLSVTGMMCMDHGQWQLTTPAGCLTGTLRGDSTVTPLIAILRFDLPRQKSPLTCILCKDSLPGDDYRRLIGVLRMG